MNQTRRCPNLVDVRSNLTLPQGIYIKFRKLAKLVKQNTNLLQEGLFVLILLYVLEMHGQSPNFMP